mgnify:FL=1
MGFLIQLSFIVLIIFSLLFYKILKIVFGFLVYIIESVLEKSSQSLTTRNNILSILYFFRDIGPNVSSVSIVALFLTPSGTTYQLTALFFLGIIIKELARKSANIFCEKVQNRKDLL